MNVYAVASLIDSPHDLAMREAWASVLEIASSANLHQDGALHFSWHVAEYYDLPEIERVLFELSNSCTGFEVTTSGFGVFSSAHPVLYLPIVRIQRMDSYHRLIWAKAEPFCGNPIGYYSPASWMPHITLGNEDSDIQSICWAGEQLTRKPLSFQFLVDHFAILYRTDKTSGIIKKFAFRGHE